MEWNTTVLGDVTSYHKKKGEWIITHYNNPIMWKSTKYDKNTKPINKALFNVNNNYWQWLWIQQVSMRHKKN